MEKLKKDELYYTHKGISEAWGVSISDSARQAYMLNAIAHILLDIAQQLEALRDEAS